MEIRESKQAIYIPEFESSLRLTRIYQIKFVSSLKVRRISFCKKLDVFMSLLFSWIIIVKKVISWNGGYPHSSVVKENQKMSAGN